MNPLPLFRTLRNETCTVTAVGPTEFKGLTRNREEVSFLISDVSDHDLELLQPNAVFHWTTGYRVNEFGQKTRVSELRFTRISMSSGERVPIS